MGAGWGGRIKKTTRTKSLSIIILVSYGVGNGGIFPITVARRHRSTHTYACRSCDNIAVACVHTEYNIN